MRKSLILLVLVSTFFLRADSCGTDLHKAGDRIEVVPNPQAESVGTSHGFAYIALNIDGDPAAHVDEILQALKKYEEEHQGLQITSFSVEKQQPARDASAHIYGLWVVYGPAPK